MAKVQSNAYVGFGRFFCNTVAPRHVPYIYERMLIQALCYKAALVQFRRRIVETTDDLTQERGDWTRRFKDLRGEFIGFTNQFWFHELTAQRQGQEIFRLQQKSLNLTQTYDHIKDQMERAHEYSEADFNSRIQRAATRLAIVGIAFAVISVSLGYLALVPQREQISWCALQDHELFFLALGVSGVLLLLVSLVYVLSLLWRKIR